MRYNGLYRGLPQEWQKDWYLEIDTSRKEGCIDLHAVNVAGGRIAHLLTINTKQGSIVRGRSVDKRLGFKTTGPGIIQVN